MMNSRSADFHIATNNLEHMYKVRHLNEQSDRAWIYVFTIALGTYQTTFEYFPYDLNLMYQLNGAFCRPG